MNDSFNTLSDNRYEDSNSLCKNVCNDVVPLCENDSFTAGSLDNNDFDDAPLFNDDYYDNKSCLKINSDLVMPQKKTICSEKNDFFDIFESNNQKDCSNSIKLESTD